MIDDGWSTFFIIGIVWLVCTVTAWYDHRHDIHRW
jgi:hypothetical protein